LQVKFDEIKGVVLPCCTTFDDLTVYGVAFNSVSHCKSDELLYESSLARSTLPSFANIKHCMKCIHITGLLDNLLHPVCCCPPATQMDPLQAANTVIQQFTLQITQAVPNPLYNISNTQVAATLQQLRQNLSSAGLASAFPLTTTGFEAVFGA
jgi:hypothetical protein